MRKHSIGNRLVSMLLVFAMALSFVPASAFAAHYYEIGIGDIAGEYIGSDGVTVDHTGKTGLKGNIDTSDTISWPIRIYDYLNDGMLFEYANAGYTGDIPDGQGGAYGGGTPAPHFTGAQNVIGIDYTTSGAYGEYAYANWLSQKYSAKDSSVETVKTKVEAVNFKDPMHLQVYYPTQQSDRSKSHVWVSDFANDNQKYYSKEDIRYIVVVYRTNDVYAQSQAYRDSDDVTWNDKTYGLGAIQFHWAVSDSTRASDYSYHVSYENSSLVSPDGARLIDISDLGDYLATNGTISGPSITLPASTNEWGYMVYDMCDPNVDSDAKAKWNTQTTVNGNSMDTIGAERIAGVKMTIPINDQGEEIDISHIAYFGTKFEAEQFGKDAVAFDNNPGEFLDAHTEYTSAPIEIPVEKPSTDYNGMDFSVSSGGGYAVDTYATWSATPSYYSWLGYSVGGVKTTKVSNGEKSYVSITNSHNSTDRSIFLWQWYQGGVFSHVTIVYKTTGFTADPKISFFERESGGGGSNMATTISGTSKSGTLKRSEGEWTYATYAFSNFADTDYSATTKYTEYGMYLPSCLTGSANADKSLDIAFVQLTTDQTTANKYGKQAADYMNGVTTTSSGNSYTTAQKQWNTGNSVAFSLLFANQGGGWEDDGTYRGGNNAYENGYFSYQIGRHLGTSSFDDAINADRNTAKDNGYPVSDQIYLLSSYPYDMSQLDMGGYKLFNTFENGILTAGLLESGITTVSAGSKTYRVPQYKEETIEYIAYLLKDSLCVGQTDSKGNYNYNFVQGTRNGEQYGYDASGKPYDLASALRAQLGITLPANGGSCKTVTTPIGDYATMTDAKKASLIGPYSSCKDNITSFVDAAYYLLMNLYIDNSYNQAQDEYKYLVLSSATLSDGRKAYVFDGGFTTGVASQTANTDAYRNSSKSATVYDKSKQSIYQSSANSKDQVYFSGTQRTTRFPFLPITDSTGVYAGETKSPYFLDDGNGVMGVTEEGSTFVNRNYNYAIASNGEFIYYAEDNLYFDFEGDDDVYLFINGELVVDVGAAHSVTTVSMNVKDYVDWAKGVLADLEGYDPSMTNRQMEELLNSKNLTAAKKAEYLRAHRLNLQEGEVCQFDFYYMERHGWGANCRIASNIRVTEPDMRVEKHAYQGGDEIAYSDVIVASDPVEYNFKMINNGSSKLFNLTFTDSTIGVTLDYTNGLTVANGYNGIYVFDANGGTLEASDITALVTGWMPVETGGTHIKDIDGNYVEDANGTHVYTSIENTFKTQQELKNFLASLQGEGMDNAELDTTHLQSGYGLWVDADVTFKGIYYKLSVQQVDAGVLDNTVYVTATSMLNPNTSGNQVLQSQARHRVYVTGLPYYYQWAGHNLYLAMADIMEDTIEAAKDTGNQAHEYESFLNSIKGKTYNYALCDKFGVVKTYQEVVPNSGNDGYIVNFPEAGTHCFYILVSTETITTTTKAADLTTGKYAIVRITVFAADVEDSYYVLDYGLKTEDLGTNGELFKNDYLFGGSTDNQAKMMGIATTQPSYLSYPEQTTNYNRIQFTAVESNTSVTVGDDDDGVGDGYYTIQIDNGKDITFNSYTGNYSLSDIGTVQVNVYTPTDWTNAYLYYWYDGGSNNGWPGTAMERVTAGQYKLDVPADITHVIISSGSQQTGNLMITPGIENTIKVTNRSGDSEGLDAQVETFALPTVTVTVPDGWGDVYLYCWNSVNSQNNGDWPGTKLEVGTDGKYTTTVSSSYDRMIVNNGNGTQTKDLEVPAGADLMLDVLSYAVTINVPDDWGDVYLYCWNDGGEMASWPGTKIDPENGKYRMYVPSEYNNLIVNDGAGRQTPDLQGDTSQNVYIDCTNGTAASTHLYDANISAYSSVTETYTIYVKVPAEWNNPHLYYWNSSTVEGSPWPGTKLANKNADGLYAIEIPVDTAYVVVNNGKGSYQTIDLSVKLGVEGTVSVTTPRADGKYLATIDYSDEFTFTPTKFMSDTYSIWMAITVHNIAQKVPTPLGNPIDVTKEVQLYKKITVLPANVVYYEDDFPALKYNEDSGNTFTPIGSSSDLTQSVDQSQEYGQDNAYQNNIDMSGNSLQEIEIIYSDEVLVKIPSAWTNANPHLNYYDRSKNLISLPMEKVAQNDGTYSVHLPPMIFDVFVSHDELARYVEVTVPSTWQNAYLSYIDLDSTFHCEVMTKTASGTHTLNVPNSVKNVILTSYQINSEDDIQNVVLNVPENWENAYVSYQVDEEETMTSFQLTKNADGTYSCHVPSTIRSIVISDHDLADEGTNLNGEELQIRKTGSIAIAKSYIYHITVNEKGSTSTKTLLYSHKLADPDFVTKLTILDSGKVTSENVAKETERTETIRITRGYQNTIDATNPNNIEVKTLSGVVASFTFTGTGFELISRTNADDSASIVVEVTQDVYTTDENGKSVKQTKVVKRIPVITQFDNNENGTTPGGDEAIYQVPAIRVDGLKLGEYTVNITGIPSPTRKTILYLDGIRIFQPLGPTNEHYNEDEKNAIFTEIRKLIVSGKAAVAKYNGNALSVSSGTITWTENLNGKDYTGINIFTGNQVNSVNDYLIKGPNNEVYMNGTIENAALVFTVKKTSGTPSLQIAVRAIDEVLFYLTDYVEATDSSDSKQDLSTVIEFYAKQPDGTFAWEPLVTLTSGTEQYYTIDLDRCYTKDGEILVAVRAKSGMASFTSLKHKNLEFTETVGGEVATYKFINGELAICRCHSKCTAEGDGIRWACALCSTGENAHTNCESTNICSCTVKCSTDNVNKYCAICYRHNISGCEAECTCTTRCTEENHNAQCDVCNGKYSNCGVPVCICTVKCTEDMHNEGCEVCNKSIAECVVIEMTESETTNDDTTPSLKQSGISLPYFSYMMARPSVSDTVDAPENEILPDNQQPEVTPDPEDQPQQTPGSEPEADPGVTPEVDPGTTPEVDPGTQPEEKPAEKPVEKPEDKPDQKPGNNSGNNKPSNSGNTQSNNNIAAQVAAKIAAIQNRVSDARNQLKGFVGEFAALFR